MPKNEPILREVRCDDPAVETMNQLTGKDRGHSWIVIEWSEDHYPPQTQTYNITYSAGGAPTMYGNGGSSGGYSGTSNPPTRVNGRATKLMCQYCQKVINAPQA